MECKFKFCANEAKQHKDVYLSIKATYVTKDHAFDSINGGGATVLVFNDNSFGLQLDNESKRIGGFSDYLPSMEKLDKISIKTPKNFDEGILYLDSTAKFISGIGYRLDMAKGLYYDKKTNNFQIGSFDHKKLSHRFLNNAYAQIDENGKLTGIIVTGIIQ